MYIPNDEEKAFEEILPKLFEALKNGNEDAIYDLFSPTVRKQSNNLQEQISALITDYSVPIDEFDLENVPSSSKTRSRCSKVPPFTVMVVVSLKTRSVSPKVPPLNTISP